MVRGVFQLTLKTHFARVSWIIFSLLHLWLLSVCLSHSRVEYRHLKQCVTGKGRKETLKSCLGKTLFYSETMFQKLTAQQQKTKNPDTMGVR